MRRRKNRQVLGAAGTVILLLDHFSDTDGTDITTHVMDVGPGWSAIDGAGQIQSNRLTTSGAAGAHGDWSFVADSGQANVTVSATVRNMTAGSDSGLVLRSSAAWGDFWLVNAEATGGNFRLYEVASGSFVQRASASAGVTTNTDYALSATASGTTISATLNGGSPISYGSASSNQTATRHGIRLGGINNQADDFQVTTP